MMELSIIRNILCFPICDNNEVIGVAELCNKQSGTHFTKFDQEMAMAFRQLAIGYEALILYPTYPMQFLLWPGHPAQPDVQESG